MPTVSLDLFLVDGPAPPDSASGRRLLDDALAELPRAQLCRHLRAALDDLLLRLPEDHDGALSGVHPVDEPSPWVVQPLLDGTYGRVLHLAVSTGAGQDVLETILEVAISHGLVVLGGDGDVLAPDGAVHEVPLDGSRCAPAGPDLGDDLLPKGWRRRLDRTVTTAFGDVGLATAYRTGRGLSRWWLGTPEPAPGPVFILDRVHGTCLRGEFWFGHPDDEQGLGSWRPTGWHPSREAYRAVVLSGPMGPHDRVARSWMHWWLGGEERSMPVVVDQGGLEVWVGHVLPEVVAHAQELVPTGR